MINEPLPRLLLPRHLLHRRPNHHFIDKKVTLAVMVKKFFWLLFWLIDKVFIFYFKELFPNSFIVQRSRYFFFPLNLHNNWKTKRKKWERETFHPKNKDYWQTNKIRSRNLTTSKSPNLRNSNLLSSILLFIFIMLLLILEKKRERERKIVTQKYNNIVY